MITLPELFEFNENDLKMNRAGRLSPSQQAKWQQGLSRSRRFQHGGALVFALVIGVILLGSTLYVRIFLPDIPPETFPWLIGAGILMIVFPVLLGLNGMLTTRRRVQNLEARIADGQVKRIVGRVQLTRTFYLGAVSYTSGYNYSISMNAQELIYGGGHFGSNEESGQALFEAFGLPMPPKQNETEKMRHVPQVEDSHGEYFVYYLENGWGQLQVFSIEKASE